MPLQRIGVRVETGLIGRKSCLPKRSPDDNLTVELHGFGMQIRQQCDFSFLEILFF